MYKQATELMLNFKDRILIKGEEDTGKSTLLTEIRISDSDSRYYNFKTLKEGANKRGNSSRLTQSFHFFMFEPIFSPVNALNQPI